MDIEFTAHNIRLDDGTLTKPDVGYSMEAYPWFVSARRILETVFPEDKHHLRLVDIGCLEGGYAVEFARMGFQVLGIEVREANIAACNYVKSKINLPNLEFVKDNALNIARHGIFDVVFCCGLLYHLDRPKNFLETLSAVTTKLMILQTHFSTNAINIRSRLPTLLQKILAKVKVKNRQTDKFILSQFSANEGLVGRWYTEFPNDKLFSKRETAKWSSWDNRRSFWIQREYLLQAIQDVGFDLVVEQYDSLGLNIAENMLRGYYQTDRRGTFIGIKTQNAADKSPTC
ncbi:MAG: class I SAM-dependent methyltransferase [Thermodesulfobacteriota bacterium]|jgi:SAM-dependent methyltransferase